MELRLFKFYRKSVKIHDSDDDIIVLMSTMSLNYYLLRFVKDFLLCTNLHHVSHDEYAFEEISQTTDYFRMICVTPSFRYRTK